MENEKDILERLSAVEVQVKDISKVQEKLDQLYELIMAMKVESAGQRSDYATKQDCVSCRREVDIKLEKADADRKKLLWAVISSGSAFTLWLAEQVLHISINLGGK
jgi:hypothetical protein